MIFIRVVAAILIFIVVTVALALWVESNERAYFL